jgi:hypothetical protein
VFKGDLVGFFMSIDKELLWYLLERFIRRQHTRYERHGWKGLDTAILARLDMCGMPEMYWDILLRTTKAVVMHHPERDCILNTHANEWLGLAPNKSLFTSPTGEPIGNLTTQLFANFLMSFFVAYIQWLYRGKNYCFAQFVDDFVIVCDDLRFLVDSIPKIEAFLGDKLRLKLHKDKRYLQPVSHGVKFVGAYIKPKRIYLSNQTVSRMMERCHGFRKMMETRDLEEWEIDAMLQTLNSYLGFTRKRETYKIRQKALKEVGDEFWRYFYLKGSLEAHGKGKKRRLVNTVKKRINIKQRRYEHLRRNPADSIDSKDAERICDLHPLGAATADRGGAGGQRSCRAGGVERASTRVLDGQHDSVPPCEPADRGRLRADGDRRGEKQVFSRRRGGHNPQLLQGQQEGSERDRISGAAGVERTGKGSGEACVRTSCLSGDRLLIVWEEGGTLVAEFKEADF